MRRATMQRIPDPYRVLGVGRDATTAELKAAAPRPRGRPGRVLGGAGLLPARLGGHAERRGQPEHTALDDAGRNGAEATLRRPAPSRAGRRGGPPPARDRAPPRA